MMHIESLQSIVRGGAILALGALAAPCTAQADFAESFDDVGPVNQVLNAWSARDGSADFNGDGVINTQDVLSFLNAWNAGC